MAGRTSGNMTSGVTAGCAGVAAGQKLGTPDLYYDPCAFTLQAAGFEGNAGRGILRGPGFENLDFSLVKDTSINSLGESGKLEFRAEIFNVLNAVNPSIPTATGSKSPASAKSFAISPGTPDVINNAPVFGTGGPRKIQLGAKLIF